MNIDLRGSRNLIENGEGAVTDVSSICKRRKSGNALRVMQQSCTKRSMTILIETRLILDFSDESIRESDDKFFQAMKRDENSDKILYGIVDSKRTLDGDKYSSITKQITSGLADSKKCG